MIGRPPKQLSRSNAFGGRSGCAVAATVAMLLGLAIAPVRAQVPGYLGGVPPAAEVPAGPALSGAAAGGLPFADIPLKDPAWMAAAPPPEMRWGTPTAEMPAGVGPPDTGPPNVGSPAPPAPQLWGPAATDSSNPPLLSAGPSRIHRLLDCLDVDWVARGYYLNDQRVAWSGMEATFGAEAAVDARLVQRAGEWQIKVEGEFYLNEPFDRDMLLNTQERRSYASDFCVDTFEISQLSLMVTRGDFSLLVGKMVTPFGRTYFPLFTNARLDAPYIRTEAIGWRETGILLRYRAGNFVGDVAVTNGGENRDTNSMKALIARLGLENEHATIGCSIKVQDGVGSDEDKEFDNHFGFDAMLRLGPWVLSGEAIYDQYGFFHPGFDPDDIYWYRSIYYRDESSGTQVPLSGLGYYFDLGYEQGRWNIDLNFGQFCPLYVGTAPSSATSFAASSKWPTVSSLHCRVIPW